MKVRIIMSTLLLASGMMAAQSSQSSQPTSPSTGMSGMKMESSPKSQEMMGMKQHMQQMQADMEQMKSQIAKMRSEANKVQDPSTKAALLDNADLWEKFTTRMQEHMNMMMQGGMPHQGMMMHGHKGSQTGQQSNPNPK
ncbi:MAG TPA: hypothetical protein VN577_08430 [Terriglobales bacterium]|jgi:TolA-binding protein|nr:hypothetical protein [Terriglobales bacterium]